MHRNVRARVFPCEAIAAASDFDFWVGRWEVRLPDGTLVGHNTIEKNNGGCSIEERWQGSGGSSGTSVSFFLPSRGEWRQVWTGSGGTLFDITGRFTDGAMRMEGQIEYVDQDKVVAFRGTWTRARTAACGSGWKSSISRRSRGWCGSTASIGVWTTGAAPFG